MINGAHDKEVYRLNSLSNHCFFRPKRPKLNQEATFCFVLNPCLTIVEVCVNHPAAMWDTFGAILADVPLTSVQRNAKLKGKERSFGFEHGVSVFDFKGCDMLLFTAVVRMPLLTECQVLTSCRENVLRYGTK